MAARVHELAGLVELPAFFVDDTAYSWGDVLLSAELRGTFARLTEETKLGVAAARRTTVEPEAVRAAAAQFRHGRGLLSAEELEAWLARWRIELGEWTEHVRRGLLLERRGAELEPAAEDAEVARAVAVDAACSGFLEREARQLASAAVLAAGDAHGIAEIVASAADARAALGRASDVEREIELRALEWTRIDAELLELADMDAAGEAALCVRVDGRSLEDVAADCGVPLQRRAVYLEDAEHELLGARAGDLVGPVARDGGYLLVHVLERTPPSADDPELRRRAESYLVDRAIERELEKRLRWA